MNLTELQAIRDSLMHLSYVDPQYHCLRLLNIYSVSRLRETNLFKALRLWNTLSLSLRFLNWIIFKKQMKTFLITQACC